MLFIALNREPHKGKKPEKPKPADAEDARKFKMLKALLPGTARVEIEFLAEGTYHKGLKSRYEATILREQAVARRRPERQSKEFAAWAREAKSAVLSLLDARITYLTELIDFAKRKEKPRDIIQKFKGMLDRAVEQRKTLIDARY
jgi:hypothetical protein